MEGPMGQDVPSISTVSPSLWHVPCSNTPPKRCRGILSKLQPTWMQTGCFLWEVTQGWGAPMSFTLRGLPGVAPGHIVARVYN